MVGHEIVRWSDQVDEILDGDHVAALAYATPARGTVLLPLSNFAVRDREAGTVSFNSSVGAWKKLDRIRRDPHVALAFHTREHARTQRSEYVLVQGRATLSEPTADYPSTIVDNWERFESWRDAHPLWRWWQRAYALRVEIKVSVARVIVWPDLRCRGTPEVQGAALPAEAPPPQRPPARGVGPRLDHVRAARKAARLPHVLLGWIGQDRFPVVTAVRIGGTAEDGIVLEAPEGLVPPGGRRAGLTAHWFSHGVVGQDQRKHTGWLEAGEQLVYAPHTQANYRFPASTPLFRFVSGAATRWGLRGARRAGLLA